MRGLSIISFLLLFLYVFAQNVVINEVLYDPVGSDAGYEWIELYNNSEDTINLHNWIIEKAGTSFSLVFVFPPYNFPPYSYLLIGEANVPNTDLSTSLAFQNGGSETDGIRLISPDTLYTDTILYDSPNTNNLPDDLSSPGIYFAVDVAGGNSLGRKHDGEDSNNCELDFFECTEPTPAAANFYPVDLAIYELEITINGGEYWLQTEVFNLSTEDVDNGEANLEISINNATYSIYALPAIPAVSSLPFNCNLGSISGDYIVIKAELSYIFDNALENNTASSSLLLAAPPIIINELMFKPLSTNQEWIELFNRSDCAYLVDNWKISDASGGEISFSGFLEAGQFLIVCQDSILLMQVYPDIDPNRIAQTTSWTSLNNTEETLILRDGFATHFDSLWYNGGNCPADFSLERVNPFEDENVQWLPSLDSLGTPAFINSVLPIARDLELEFAEIWDDNGEVFHKILIRNLGLENILQAELICSLHRFDGSADMEIIQEIVSLADSLELILATEMPESGYNEFIYRIESDEDLNASNNVDCSFFDNCGLPFVINEIMYAPSTEMPEWLEIKFNLEIMDMENFYLVVDEDTLEICYPDPEIEYLIVTSSANGIDSLQSVYGLEDIPLVSGLPALSNNGEYLALIDECDNLIEDFFFLPEWNNKISGISIERVNSCLPAAENNWGPSVSGCTPGEENSIFVQVLPPEMKLSVAPNPFSPYRGEFTVFSFKLPEVISRCTLRIFDLKGRMLRKLVDQQLQAATGNIVWNGKDDQGRNMPIGVYVVLLEAVSLESEKVYKKKITVVIGK